MIKLKDLLNERYSIKPQDLVSVKNKYGVSNFKNMIKGGIDKNSKLDDNMKLYLKDLIDGKVNMKKYPIENTTFFNEVEKDFGEVLGSIYVANNGKIEFPTSLTFPLVDFLVHDKNKIRQYSAKGGKSTSNTMKIKDIANIIDNNTEYYSLYKDTFTYYVMDILNQSSVKDAALNLADVLNISYDKNKQDDGHERYRVEREVINYLNKEIDKFNKMINSILTIDYVMTKINSKTGNSTITIKSAKNIGIKFRSKNNAPTAHKPQGRWKDKIGFQVR
jgi:hypothetical protein|tara:strand:- start:263 stop:1090 length:828 start_codon:yes stop_codon:yes gene_type:complete